MQIVIELPEYVKTNIESCEDDEYMYGLLHYYEFKIAQAIKNGIPLPQRHGRLIDADAVKEELQWAIAAEPTITGADKKITE